MRRILLWMIWCLAAMSAVGQSNTPLRNMPYFDGDIYSMVTDGTTVYMGGAFTMVGSSINNVRPRLAVFDYPALTLSNTTMPLITSGGVYAAAPDGSGGWYIAGDFTSVAGQTRNRLARINSDGSLHSWNPNVSTSSSYVYALIVSGGKVYIGGTFNTVGGQTRNQLAAFDQATGNLDDSWNPGANGTVYTLLADGGKIYIGGGFSTIGGVARNGLAAVDQTTGVLDAFNPSPNSNSVVRTMFISGSKLYFGGNFTTLGASTRRRAAAWNLTTGVLDTWDPNIESASTNIAFNVYALALYNGKVYMGGNFSKVSAAGTARNRLAAVDATTGALDDTWNPNVSADVLAMLVKGSKLYVGGAFTTISTTNTRYRFAAFDLTNGSLVSGTPALGTSGTTANLQCFAATESALFLGGTFTGAGGSVRTYLAAINAADGSLQSWNPTPNNYVNSLHLNGTSLYAGGSFTFMGGVSGYSRLAKWDLTTGNLVTTWKPNVANNGVSTLQVIGSKLYFGGTFTAIGATTRNKLAAVSVSDGTLDSWDPNANGDVNTMIESGGTLYVGGAFTTLGGATYNRLAAFNGSTGAILPDWKPEVDAGVSGKLVKTLLPLGTDIIVGGFYASIGGQTRNGLAAVSATGTGAVNDAWNPSLATNSSVKSLLFSDAKLIIGGQYNSVKSTTRSNLAAIDETATTLYPWAPVSLSGSVETMFPLNGNIWVGGQMIKIGGFEYGKLAVFTPSVSWNGSVSSDWGTAANWTPASVPVSVTDLTIPAGLSNYPTLSGNTTLANLTIPTGASLDLADKTLTMTANLSSSGTFSAGSGKLNMAGAALQTITGNLTVKDVEINNAAGVTITAGVSYKLNVTGTLQLTSGTLTTGSNLVLMSSATGSARIAPHSTTSAISGSVIVERFINVDGKDKQWRTLGFPHSAALTISSITGFATDYAAGSRSLMYYNEGADDGAYSGGGGTQRNAGYVSYTANTATIAAGKGVMAWLYGNSGGTAGPGTMTGSLTIRSTGALNETGADVNLPVSYTATNTFRGWNLVANPFVSAIDWNAADIVKTNLDNTIYRWNPASASWTTYNGSIGNPANVDAVIEAGSAFFVKANAASPVLTIKQNAKTSSGTGFSHFSRVPLRVSGIPSERTPSPSAKLAGIRVRVQGQGNPLPDEAYLDISRNDATANFDSRYDAESMSRSSGAGIGILGKNEVIHALLFDPPIAETGLEKRYYPLKVTSPVKGATTLELWTEGSWNPQNSVTLIDKKEGKTLLLKEGRISYPFTMDELKSEDRFILAINHMKTDASGRITGFEVKIMGNPVTSDRIELMVIHPSAKAKHWSVMTMNGQQVGTGSFLQVDESIQHRLTVPAMRLFGQYILRISMDNGEEKAVKFIRH